MIEMFDSHAHYNDSRFDEDREELIKEMYEKGVTKIIVAGCSVETTESSIELANKYKHIYATAGIHPSDIENIEKDILKIEDLAKHDKVVGIGEIGLDYYYTKENKEEQKEAFVKQIELANKLDLPIVIHSRDAYMDTIEVIKNNMPKRKGVFHCCQLNMELIKEAVNLGFNLSFGGPITFKNSKNVKECLELIPLERLQIETDAPYLSPDPLRGQRNISTNMIYVLGKMAEIYGKDVNELAQITYSNTLRMFEKIKN